MRLDDEVDLGVGHTAGTRAIKCSSCDATVASATEAETPGIDLPVSIIPLEREYSIYTKPDRQVNFILFSCFA